MIFNKCDYLVCLCILDKKFEEEDIGPSHLLKRTVNCFGKAQPFNLLTSIQGSTIAYGIQSVGQMVPAWSVYL